MHHFNGPLSGIKRKRTPGNTRGNTWECCKEFEEYFLSLGICHETIAPYYLKLNAVAELDNHMIVHIARNMLYAKKFWAVL
jgi:hypothetical protein